MWQPKSDEIKVLDEEEALKLAALQRSPTYVRARTSIFRNVGGEVSLVGVDKLDAQQQTLVMDKLITALNEDPELFFKRVRQRFDK